jgi:zinc D-Ala-D-Ala carboxypeptidase
MTYRKPARTAASRTRSTILAALVVVSTAAIGAFGYQSWAASPSATSPIDVFRGEHADAPSSPTAPLIDVLRSEHHDALVPRRDLRDALAEADGGVSDDTTVFDEEIAGVANLDPALLGALRRAATNAADDGVEFFVNSGWRSPKEQEQLFREAVSKYGSEEEAARWVSTPNTSAHVSGDAVDIGPSGATAWLKKHGAKYGLCQIYRNEPWHYVLRPTAIEDGCPPLYADPTQDPRMQR